MNVPLETLTAYEILTTDWPDMTTIYILVDPRTSQARYIGQSIDPVQRLVQHISQPQDSTKEWIKELDEHGLEPLLVYADEIETGKAHRLERDWIRVGYDVGWPLLNESMTPAIPRDQYEALLAELKAMRGRLTTIGTLLGRKWPSVPGRNKIDRRTSKAQAALINLSSAIEDSKFSEYPNDDARRRILERIDKLSIVVT